MRIDIDEKPESWISEGRPLQSGPSSPPVAMLGIGAVALVFLGLAFLATRSPTCESASIWIETIITQEKAGQWEIAATNARTILTKPNLCQDNRRVLAEKAIANGLKALWDTKFSPQDPVAQRHAVDRYQGLRRLAQEYDVGFPGPREVAAEAYKVGQFLLAKESFEEALENNIVTVTDQTQARFYYDTIYNLGWWWTRDKASAAYTDGLGLLAAANQIDRQYRLGSGLAWGDLKSLLGSDESSWPTSAATPLLKQTA